MQRREFITLLGASPFAWPLAARAQQATGMRRVAFLHPYAENDAVMAHRDILRRPASWVANGAKQTSTAGREQLDRSRMTRSGLLILS